MTIQRTREILGKDSKKYSDDEILELIRSADVMTDILFDIWEKMPIEEKEKFRIKSLKKKK